MLVTPVIDHPDISPVVKESGVVNNSQASSAIWMFYESNPDRVLIKVSFIKIRVRDLRFLFEILAGPEN